MALSVAVQVYSVRDYAEKDMRGTLQKIKDMGYEGVEFAGLYGYSAE
jgi:sugar phosphate isomerase/epimerase